MELKYLAQRAFISYMKSVFLSSDKVEIIVLINYYYSLFSKSKKLMQLVLQVINLFSLFLKLNRESGIDLNSYNKIY